MNLLNKVGGLVGQVTHLGSKAEASGAPAPSRLYYETFKLGELERSHAPKFTFEYKRKIYESTKVAEKDDPRQVIISKWPEIPYPDHAPNFATVLTMQQDAFAYPESPAGQMFWHVNFADEALFGFYGGALFAQDEIQATEHPILGSVREVMTDRGRTNPNADPRTRAGRGGKSTPVLVQGAMRRVKMYTGPSALAPSGIYGQRFQSASWAAIEGAFQVISPPTETNFIAMEAPKGHHGKYKRAQIDDIFNTAYSSFVAAKYETEIRDPKLKTAIHTGNWGCGAFGGNRVLMAFLQILAAKTAEVHELVYHSYSKEGTDGYNEAHKLLTELSSKKIHEILDIVEKKGFEWGQSDGN